MKLRTAFAIVVLVVLSSAASAVEPADRELMETIIAAQKEAQAALQQASGRALVRRSLTVTESPSRTGPPRLKRPDEGAETFIAQFRLKDVRQRVTRYSYEPEGSRTGAVIDDYLDDAKTCWTYFPLMNKASHVYPHQSTRAFKLGNDFQLSVVDGRGDIPFERLVRNGLQNCDAFEAATREDGMMVIRYSSAGHGDMPKWSAETVLDPAAGYHVIAFDSKSEWADGSTKTARYKVQWRKDGDIWVPETVSKEIDATEENGTLLFQERCLIEMLEFRANEPVADSVFTLQDLAMAPGTNVVDVVANTTYKYQTEALEPRQTRDILDEIKLEASEAAPPAPAPPAEPPAPPVVPPAPPMPPAAAPAVETTAASLPQQEPAPARLNMAAVILTGLVFVVLVGAVIFLVKATKRSRLRH